MVPPKSFFQKFSAPPLNLGGGGDTVSSESHRNLRNLIGISGISSNSQESHRNLMNLGISPESQKSHRNLRNHIGILRIPSKFQESHRNIRKIPESLESRVKKVSDLPLISTLQNVLIHILNIKMQRKKNFMINDL